MSETDLATSGASKVLYMRPKNHKDHWVGETFSQEHIMHRAKHMLACRLACSSITQGNVTTKLEPDFY